ncbi:hypothetical protein [Rhodohalobacter mucosus]|uniref:hypothetical protein n=1 Tax=Rhodohalobacter mucosus TaxID=2079485 RepID=UPI0011B287AC|nr:hypothetical protein [Rhodohalobacter mucosus]
MKNKLKHLMFIALLSCLWFGCNEVSDRYAPVYEFFPEAELSHVLIEEQKIIEVRIDPVDSSGVIQTLDTMAGGDFLIHIGDSLVTVYNGRQSILILDTETGQTLGQYTFTGRGPGEYQRIDQLLYSNGYFLIVDASLGKVIRFDSRFQFLEEYEIRDMFPQSGFAYRHPLFFYPVNSDPDYLIKKLFLNNPDVNPGFHKRIISIGKQPSGYNRVLMDVNGQGDLLVTAIQMPLLFMYGSDTSVDRLIRLHYSEFEMEEEQVEFDQGVGQRVLVNPPPVEIETDQVIRGRNLISGLLYRDDEVMLIHSGMITLLRTDGNEFHHVKSIRVFDQDGEPFYPMYMAWIDDDIYLSSKFRDYIVRLDPSSLYR